MPVYCLEHLVHLFCICQMMFFFYLQPQEEFQQSIPLKPVTKKRISFRDDEADKALSKDYNNRDNLLHEVQKNPVNLNPKVHIIADYIM